MLQRKLCFWERRGESWEATRLLLRGMEAAEAAARNAAYYDCAGGVLLSYAPRRQILLEDILTATDFNDRTHDSP